MGHEHGIETGEAGSASAHHLGRLWVAVGLGALTLVTQVVVGLRSSSLALLSDSAHVFTDVFGILMAIAAIKLAQQGAKRSSRSFGLYRAEVFAALFNALLLFGVAGWIMYEAAQRISDPPEVPGAPVVLVALFGLAMNVIAFAILRSGAKESLNVRGAYLEVMADMLGSIGVLVSGLMTVFFGWRYADPIIAVAIGLFVLPRAFGLGRQAVRILIQQAPQDVDVDSVKSALERVRGVESIHDLHVWTLTSGMEVATAHLTLNPDAQSQQVLSEARAMLAADFGLDHATLQVESAGTDGQCRELNW